MEEIYYKIWISLIKNLGIKKYLKLINKFKTNKNIFNATAKELMTISEINEKDCNNILNKEIKQKAKNHLQYMMLNNIEIISILDEDYPKDLRNIYSPPICIYLKGNRKCLNGNNISIVGSRNCSEYGKKVSQKLAYDLAKDGINIVSGLAKGIDSNAHLGTIFSNGKTIAVLGNSLNEIYPKENYFLANKILEKNGAIISELPLESKIEKNNFPARNRIISGLSKAIIIVEASKKSGALITADFALEQGKDVFVVPGNITSITSEGTNELLKQGAIPITNYKDIIL